MSDQPKTILIVDDSEQTLLLLRIMLERVGYKVQTANNGADALARLNEMTPDLIVTDLMMPGMDGVELTRAIRGRTATRATPILLRSYRYLDEAHQKQARDAGANDVMDLLVVPTAFLPRVKALLEPSPTTLPRR